MQPAYNMRNKGENNKNYLKYRQTELPYQYSISTTEDGKTKVEFLDKRTGENQFYNTTSLIIDNKPVFVNDVPLRRCSVGWYNDYDTIILGMNRENTDVLAEIDPSLMTHDEEYTCAVMKMLLNRKRVMGYLSEGMSKEAKKPCGNYIGAIKQKDGRYIKFFDEHIGSIIHYSRGMSDKRRRYDDAKRQNAIKRRQELNNQINKLQDEIRKIDQQYNLDGFDKKANSYEEYDRNR